MMRTNIQQVLICICCIIVMVANGQNASEDFRPTLIIVAFRPGLQEPGRLKADNSFFHGGDDFSIGEMTSYGKKQSYGLGKYLRKRYNDVISFRNSKDEIKAVSSSFETSQTTMQMVLNGMFGNERNFDELEIFSPSYAVDDTLLKMGKATCPEYENVVGKFRDDSTKEVQDWLSKEKKTIDIVSQETGINASLASLSTLGASIMHRRYLKQSDAQWTSSGVSMTNLTKSVFEKLSQYADAPSTLCANDRSCRRLLAGYWVSYMLELLRKKQRNDSTIKMMLFSSPVDSLMSAMKLLKIESHSAALPSGGFILEYKDKPEPSVRLISHDAEEDNAEKRIVRAIDLPFCRSFDWCPLETFISNITPDTVGDWRDLCKVRRCDVPLSPGKTLKSVECPIEFDRSGKDSCSNWAKYNYCNDYDTVRWLYCRRTCLCDPDFV